MQRWLSRFSFTFLIIGGFLAWQGYRALKGEFGFVPQWRIILYFVAAALSFSLGASGIRQRHRSE